MTKIDDSQSIEPAKIYMTYPRLLVIDDDRDMGEVFVRIAEGAGYKAVHTVDHLEFRDRVLRWQPSVIVVDLQMPDVDGLALLRFVAESGAGAKVVIASGMDRRVIEAAKNLTFLRGLTVAAIITKPFRAKEVEDIFQRLKVSQSAMSDALGQSLDGGKIDVYFQPQCLLSTGAPIGFEALARWNHPLYGDIGPDVFVPIAEHSGLSVRLLLHVLGKTLQKIAALSTRGYAISGSVNMSMHDMRAQDLPEHLASMCAAAGVSCSQVTLELVEGAATNVHTDILDVVTRLRLKGFHLSIDDLGMGFSSLSRLREFPFNEIKIDRSFISRVVEDPDSGVIVKALAMMAESLDMRCIAEGIEDEITATCLLNWKCPVGQGYHFGRPMQSREFDEWINWRIRRTESAAAGAAGHASPVSAIP